MLLAHNKGKFEIDFTQFNQKPFFSKWFQRLLENDYFWCDCLCLYMIEARWDKSRKDHLKSQFAFTDDDLCYVELEFE